MTHGKIFVAGHRGMVGAAIVRRLEALGLGDRLLLAGREALDLLDQAAVRRFFQRHAIERVYLAAARVGGIHANDTYPAEFIHQNLVIQCNVIHAAWEAGVPRLLFLGSSCIYPKHAPQPIPEEALLTGPLEPTNEPYAVAKIAGLKMCESYHRQYGCDFRSVMPTNLYGPGDNFHPDNAHVIPALLRRFHEAAQRGDEAVTVWGSGTPRREFLHVDDMAAACVHVMELDEAAYQSQTAPMRRHLNVGTGQDVTIAELAQTIARVTGFGGRIVFDPSKPDGTPRKLLDVARIRALGWQPSIGLEEGLRSAYAWYCEHAAQVRQR